MREGPEYTPEMMLEIERKNPEEARRIREHNLLYEQQKVLSVVLGDMYLVARGLRRKID